MTAPTPAKITVVLALYNGAAHVMDQITSLLTQTLPPHQIIITDDGSTDDGPALIRALAARHPAVDWVFLGGPQRGFAANFLAGLAAVEGGATHVALCDQDDIWLPTKLASACDMLAPTDGAAALCGCTFVCDTDLQNRHATAPPPGPLGFDNALVQNVMAGNTIVLNAAAVHTVQRAIAATGTVVAHDWWIYQVLTGTGATILWQDTPQVLYRQHDKNIIGANAGIRAKIGRLGQLLMGRFKDWNDVNLAALGQISDMFTPQAQAQLQAFAAARRAPVWRRIAAVRASGVRRQTRGAQISLYVAAVLGKL